MMSEDRLGVGGHEMRLSVGGGEAGPCILLPSAESLLGRLEHIDLRLRQLEEKQRHLPESSYFTADLLTRGPGVLQQPCKSLSSALHEVHLKGTLMDRLHLLESRIRQLSFDLDKSSGGMSSSTAVGLTGDERWLQSIAVPDKKQQDIAAPCSIGSKLVVGAPRRTRQIFQRGTRELQDQKSKMKAMEPKDGIDVAEKRANAMRQNEKRRLERTQIYRRWFPVGC